MFPLSVTFGSFKCYFQMLLLRHSDVYFDCYFCVIKMHPLSVTFASFKFFLWKLILRHSNVYFESYFCVIQMFPLSVTFGSFKFFLWVLLLHHSNATVGVKSLYRAKSLYPFSAAAVFYPYINFLFFFLIFSKYSSISTMPHLFIQPTWWRKDDFKKCIFRRHCR